MKEETKDMLKEQFATLSIRCAVNYVCIGGFLCLILKRWF